MAAGQRGAPQRCPWHIGRTDDTRRELPESPYLAAADAAPHRVPVWFMRRAGRSC